MSADSKTILVWKYSPGDFYEEPVTVHLLDGEVSIAGGTARGVFDAGKYDDGREFLDSAHQALLVQFQAHQVQTSKTFEVSEASMTREHADGRKDVTVFPGAAIVKLTGHATDIVIRDAQGKVTTDTRAERLRKHERFREDVAALIPHDHALKRMLQSYSNAIADKDNALVHLYEIREAASVAFGGDEKARKALGVSRSEWSEFGRMANEEPLIEGRHRGKHDDLRNATLEELSNAADFAQTLIENYVEFRKKGEVE